MLHVAISQLTTPRCELSRELRRLADHGFASLGLWRPKLPDAGATAAAALLGAAGVRATSLRSAGGFTGGDGRSFVESVADAVEAVQVAAELGRAAAADRPPILVLHGGSRGGHTRGHATRLLLAALEALVPAARREGVVMALEPLRAAAAPGCCFLGSLGDALDVVEICGDPHLGLALDLWQFGDDPALAGLLPRLASAAFLVRVADRCGLPAPDADRLPAGHGTLPLEQVATGLARLGYRGALEFDPVGETVEVLGYEGVLRETRLVADAWAARIRTTSGGESLLRTAPSPAGGGPRGGHFRRTVAGSGSRRSQASNQTVSRG